MLPLVLFQSFFFAAGLRQLLQLQQHLPRDLAQQ